MNFRKNWKQFWTLDRHHAEGFTLVELIVVIAILAILSAVAVPAYSGYITKTHKTNDQTLVSEVSDALQLFYYAHPNAGAAYVVLTAEGTPSAGDANGVAAMNDVFGAGWEERTNLSYGEWVNDGILSTAISQGANAQLISNSTFLTSSSTDELLNNVTDLTGSAVNFMTNNFDMDSPSLYSGLVENMAATPDEFDALCAQYGIETTGTGSNKSFAEGVTSNQLANLMVIAAANDLQDGTPSTRASGLVGTMALIHAATKSSNDPGMNAAYDELAAQLAAQTSMGGMEEVLSNFQDTYSTQMETYQTSEFVDSDFQALYSIMGAVGTASNGLTANDLNNANLYRDGTISNSFNSYVNSTSAIAQLTPEQLAALQNAINAGGMVIMMSPDNAGSFTVSCSSSEAMLQK